MLGSGKQSGCLNEASNLKANQNLTSTIEQMNTREYLKNRDLDDVIPTHRRAPQEAGRDNGVAVYDPVTERAAAKLERGNATLDEDNSDEDAELLELRRTRMQRLKQQTEKAADWRSKQHGEYREISQDEFFSTVVREKGGSDRCCVHFYHGDFERCKVMDHRLSELAQQVLAVRFVKINAERAPFLVERLGINMLPCCLLFKDDVCVDRVVGFEGCTDENGALDAEMLKMRIALMLDVGEE